MYVPSIVVANSWSAATPSVRDCLLKQRLSPLLVELAPHRRDHRDGRLLVLVGRRIAARVVVGRCFPDGGRLRPGLRDRRLDLVRGCVLVETKQLRELLGVHLVSLLRCGLVVLVR